jgi:tripartite-type tricarboxylate transporter receptor subunit TctC
MRAVLAFVFAAVTFASATLAADYPSRPIKLIIPYPPAGITDLTGRLIAERLRAKLNQPVIVENKPGANGLIGMREMLKAKPDGYTLMVGTQGGVVINYAMDAGATYDPLRDLVPIAAASEYPLAMIVNNKTPVNSVAEFVAYAKERPGKLTFGSTGTAALDYLIVEMFMRQTGVSMVHVPYRGGPAALNDLLGGNIDVLIEVYPVVMEQIRSGAVKGLAVSSPYRLSAVPNLPTFRELGMPSVELTGWLGIYGRAGLPADIREKLAASIGEIVKDPEVQTKFRAIGFEPMQIDPKQFAQFHAEEVKRWVDFMTELGLRKK